MAHLTIWDPLTQNVIATREEDVFGQEVSIVDLNNDCSPELILSADYKLNIFQISDTGNLELINSLITKDRGWSLPTAFDLNNDGKLELILRDEEELCVIESNNWGQTRLHNTKKWHWL